MVNGPFCIQQWRIRGGAWEAWAHLLFLGQTEATPKGPKKFFWRLPAPPLSQGLDDRAPPPPLI